MKLGKSIITLVSGLVFLAGCGQLTFGPTPPPEPPAQSTAMPGEPVRADYMADSALRGDENTDGQGAVDVALEWSKKYARAAEELLELQKSDKQLHEENKKLLAELARAQMQLDQSKTELAEANEMLVEMGQELRAWKNDVVGYREAIAKEH